MVNVNDAISNYVEYSLYQGSNNAHRYFSIIHTFLKSSLFEIKIKDKNYRNYLDSEQITVLTGAEYVLVNAINEGINEGMGYSTIYDYIKYRISKYARAIGVSVVSTKDNQMEFNF